MPIYSLPFHAYIAHNNTHVFYFFRMLAFLVHYDRTYLSYVATCFLQTESYVRNNDIMFLRGNSFRKPSDLLTFIPSIRKTMNQTLFILDLHSKFVLNAKALYHVKQHKNQQATVWNYLNYLFVISSFIIALHSCPFLYKNIILGNIESAHLQIGIYVKYNKVW